MQLYILILLFAAIVIYKVVFNTHKRWRQERHCPKFCVNGNRIQL